MLSLEIKRLRKRLTRSPQKIRSVEACCQAAAVTGTASLRRGGLTVEPDASRDTGAGRRTGRRCASLPAATQTEQVIGPVGAQARWMVERVERVERPVATLTRKVSRSASAEADAVRSEAGLSAVASANRRARQINLTRGAPNPCGTNRPHGDPARRGISACRLSGLLSAHKAPDGKRKTPGQK